MDLNLAASAVDWAAGHIKKSGRNLLNIHFFGGEPFVAPEVVDVAVNRARHTAAKLGLIARFEITTNGVFNGNRARFVGDYFDTVVLSFDGTEKYHDRHRPVNKCRGSFANVSDTAVNLSRSPTELCFRTCISDYNVAQMEKTAVWFCESFRPSIINFETLKSTKASKSAGLNPPDPYSFAVHCMRACRIVESYGIGAVYAASVLHEPRYSFCPVGKDTLILSPDGHISSCYLPQQEWLKKGLDLDVGRFENDGSVRINMNSIKNLRRMVSMKPKCTNCFCRWTCAGGCHVENTPPGCSSEYNDFCIQTRIITACRLLDRMGYDNFSDALMKNVSAMQKLALQPTDCLIRQNR